MVIIKTISEICRPNFNFLKFPSWLSIHGNRFVMRALYSSRIWSPHKRTSHSQLLANSQTHISSLPLAASHSQLLVVHLKRRRSILCTMYHVYAWIYVPVDWVCAKNIFWITQSMGNQFLPVLIQGVSSLRKCSVNGKLFFVCSLPVTSFYVCSLSKGKFTNPHSKYAQHLWKEFCRTMSERGNDLVAVRANAECILVHAESPRKFFFQKSCVSGPWDHKDWFLKKLGNSCLWPLS